MRKTASRAPQTRPASPPPPVNPSPPGLIHPIIIYPFRQPEDYTHLEKLYELVAKLDSDRSTYARPMTVVDRKTYLAMESDKHFREFREKHVGRYSEILDAWCVDTCQMWCSGLGKAYERGSTDDVYWLIPGDFTYGTSTGLEVLSRLHDLPEICAELQQDVCIGEIATDHSHSKQLIDTYGTFGLLYNWFPQEAQEIRQLTERPRSEFFALRHPFLGELLRQRWYAYEQTVVTLLQAVFTKRSISRFFVGDITDLPGGRESLSSAVQQVERTERVLKSVWRERHEKTHGWMNRYRELEVRSEQVRRTALMILEHALEAAK